jgi:drug/metabolite transporter (DMT)-like permease
MIMGLTQIYPSISIMTRSLVLPTTAILSKFMIKKVFNTKQILALILLPIGVILSSMVQFMNETSNDEYESTGIGMFLLLVSALLQALEVVLENRIFEKDPQLTAFGL